MKRLLFPFIVLVAIAAYLIWQPSGSEQPGREGRAAPVVSVTPVEIIPIAESIEVNGSAQAWQAIEITARRSGKVSAVNFEENSPVDAGSVIVELEAAAERAALREAEVILAEDRRVLAEYEALIKTNAVSKTQLAVQQAKVAASEQKVAAARAELAEYEIAAPFRGYLGEREVSVGALVSPGDVITTLDDLDPLKLKLTLPEHWFAKVSKGQPIEATSVAYPGEVFNAEISSIGSRLNPATRSVEVQARLSNPEGKLRPGMLLSLRLTSNLRDAMLIDEQALLREGSETYVFRVIEGNKVERVTVSSGARRDGKVEIIEGLSTSDRVVTEGTQKVREGIAVRVAGQNKEQGNPS